MSSFGSSLINKSGKKIVPKGAPRRRPAAPSASSGVTVPSARSSAELSQTPQPEPIARQSTNEPPLITSDIAQAERRTDLDTSNATSDSVTVPSRATAGGIDTIPIVEPSATAEISRSNNEIGSASPSNHVVSSYNFEVPTVFAVSTSTVQRIASPAREESGPSKRRKLNTDDVPIIRSTIEDSGNIRQPSPSTTRTVVDRNDLDEIPTIVTSQRPSTKPRAAISKISRSSTSATDEQTQPEATTDGLVPYEVPRESPTGRPSTSPELRRNPAPTVPPLLTATVSGPKSRSRGTRRQQWQVTTQADLSSTGSNPPMEASVEADLNDALERGINSSVVMKTRKPRKDKGQKKGSRVEVAAQGETAASTQGAEEARSSLNATAEADPAAPQLTPAASGDSQAGQGTAPAAASTSASARLRNKQKRKAKERAIDSALSRSNATGTQNAIDAVLTQANLVPESPASSANPLSRVRAQGRSRSRRSSSAATESSSTSDLIEGATQVQKRSHKRADTPEENETVFITPGATKMLNLVGRDTENRVGMKSEREREMRKIDWKEVKMRRKEEEIKEAFTKGNKRSMLAGQIGGSKLRLGDADANEADLDEDELLERALARNAGNAPGIRLRIDASGQHVVEESSTFVDLGEAIDQDQANMLTVEEHDLTSSFNVHSYVTWKRKVPEERIYVSKRWSEEDTERFYDALQCCGADFGSMLSWFPGRLRKTLKRKFNIEERANPERVDETLRRHYTHRSANDTWDMEQFGLDEDSLVDPRKVEEELRVLRVEAEKEIEEERAKTAEVKYQKMRGGFSDSEEEEEVEGEDSLDVVAKARQDMIKARRKREAAEADEGSEEDIMETVEGASRDDVEAVDGEEVDVDEDDE